MDDDCMIITSEVKLIRLFQNYHPMRSQLFGSVNLAYHDLYTFYMTGCM